MALTQLESYMVNSSNSTFTFSNIAVTGSLNAPITSPRFISMYTTGVITSPIVGSSRYYPSKSITISNVFACLSQASTTDFVFKVNKNGSQVGIPLTIPATTNTFAKATISITLTTSDYLTIDVTSGNAIDLRVDFEYV